MKTVIIILLILNCLKQIFRLRRKRTIEELNIPSFGETDETDLQRMERIANIIYKIIIGAYAILDIIAIAYIADNL